MAVATRTEAGLDGIVVADTQISEVDGDLGRLIIKGRNAERLAFESSFEDTCRLLWQGLLTEPVSAQELKKYFYIGRSEAFELVKANLALWQRKEPMEALRTATSLLSGGTERDVLAYTKIAAAVGVFAASWARVQKGLAPMAPDANLSHAADLLRMITDRQPSAREVAALDIYLTTVSDHGMNASTFTARVVASTESDNVSCVVSAIGALKGPLHGGAPGPVLEMLSEIGSAENAEQWLRDKLTSGKRILPLARVVEHQAEQILAELHPERPLKANVEFYTAVLLDALQIPHELFSSMFAAGRVGGWLAHVAEQRALGRLIRPASRYTGTLED